MSDASGDNRSSPRSVARRLAYGHLHYAEGWQRTQDIAAGIGMQHRPGQSLAVLRDALYSLELSGHVEHRAQHNGHLWRARP